MKKRKYRINKIVFLRRSLLFIISTISIFYVGKALAEKEIANIDSIIIDENNNSIIKESKKQQEEALKIEYNTLQNDKFADNAKDVEKILTSYNYERTDGKKIAYLTFDDGPSVNVTNQILDILKFNDIKATFFVLGSVLEENEELKTVLIRTVNEGHAIGNHGYSHDYNLLYPQRIANSEAFFNDFEKSEKILKNILGQTFNSKVIRLPGGHMSWDTKSIDTLLNERGYSFIDWNVLNGDSEIGNKTSEELFERFKSSMDDLGENNDTIVVLMHDTEVKQNTVHSLQSIIDYLKSLGYEFRTLKNK